MQILLWKPDLVAAITAAQDLYSKKGTVTPSIPLIKPGGGTQSGGTSTPTDGNKGPDTGNGTNDQKITPPSGSVGDRTASGAGDPSNIEFGGNLRLLNFEFVVYNRNNLKNYNYFIRTFLTEILLYSNYFFILGISVLHSMQQEDINWFLL